MGRSASNLILDEGEKKYLADVIMEPEHLTAFRDEVRDCKRAYDKYMYWERVFDRRSHEPRAHHIYDKLDVAQIKSDQDRYERLKSTLPMQYIHEDEWHITDSKKICDHMGVLPFYPCVMINISPNWKGKFDTDGLTNVMMIQKFHEVLEKFISAQTGDLPRWTRWKYALECGKDGNHLHAHMVLEMNPKNIKSITSYINKGQHTIQLRRLWDNIFPVGYHGVLKGKFAVQRVMIRNRTLLRDKLNYLIEDLKPEDHSNLWDLEEVRGDF